MTGAMNAAIAGLRAHMQNLNVIGNNIANVNTDGYKSARAVFKSSIYSTLNGGSNGTQTIGGRNPSQIGYGSVIGTVDIDMGTGNYKVTGKSTDCMIDGDGFFIVGSKDLALRFKGTAEDVGVSGTFTSLNLTRVGNFDIMADGYLCKDEGNVVYGFLCTGVWGDKNHPMTEGNVPPGVKEGDAVFSDQLVPIRVPRVYKDKEGAMQVGYPSEGGKTNADDTLVAGTDGDAPPATGGDAATVTTKHLLDYGATTQTGANGELEVVDSKYSKASLSNITIDQSTGMITATCDDLDDQVITIGCIAIGKVANPNGVTQVGDSYYKASRGSGEMVIAALGGAGKSMNIEYVNRSLQETGGENGATTPVDVDGARLRSGGDTEILSNGLEMSTTDLAQEIASMITTQRGYQANTRIVTVTDQMLEELVNMKR